MAIMTALVAGLLLGTGLIMSGIANPAKVLGFLGLFGQWDPSSAFVMAGAIVVGVTVFSAVRRRGRSWLGTPIQLPSVIGVTARLMLGSAMFGIGQGLAGFCSGLVLVALDAGVPEAVGFVAATLAGMAVFSWLQRKRQASGSIANGPITHLQRIT